MESDHHSPFRFPSLARITPSADRVPVPCHLTEGFSQLLSSREALPKQVYLALLESFEAQLIESEAIHDDCSQLEGGLLVARDPESGSQRGVVRRKRDHFVESSQFAEPVVVSCHDSERLDSLLGQARSVMPSLNAVLSSSASYFASLSASIKEKSEEAEGLQRELGRQEVELLRAERQFDKRRGRKQSTNHESR